MSETDRAFIGIRPCGCITFAMVDGHGTKKDKRADLKEAIKSGCRIEVTTVGEARKRPNFLVQCDHDPPVADVDAEVERLLGEAV